MAEVDTWKSLFTNKEDLKLFVLLASQIVITGTGLNAFTQVKGWEKSDLAELVAYFESSTKDPFLKKSCIKYIYNNNLDWSKYGISKTLHAKTKGRKRTGFAENQTYAFKGRIYTVSACDIYELET